LKAFFGGLFSHEVDVDVDVDPPWRQTPLAKICQSLALRHKAPLHRCGAQRAATHSRTQAHESTHNSTDGTETQISRSSNNKTQQNLKLGQQVWLLVVVGQLLERMPSSLPTTSAVIIEGGAGEARERGTGEWGVGWRR